MSYVVDHRVLQITVPKTYRSDFRKGQRGSGLLRLPEQQQSQKASVKQNNIQMIPLPLAGRQAACVLIPQPRRRSGENVIKRTGQVI